MARAQLPPSKIELLLEKYGIKYPPCGTGMGDGWLPLIEELIQKLIAVGWDKDLQQVKEKFGSLRFYIGEENEEIHKLIEEYEEKSCKVCDQCGMPGQCGGKGWISTLCDQCRRADEIEKNK
jgi:hypothetical protein